MTIGDLIDKNEQLEKEVAGLETELEDANHYSTQVEEERDEALAEKDKLQAVLNAATRFIDSSERKLPCEEFDYGELKRLVEELP